MLQFYASKVGYTTMVFDFSSFQQDPTFSGSQPLVTAFDSVAGTGMATIVVALDLTVPVITGLGTEVSVAVWTVDPLLEGAAGAVVAFRASVTADVVFHSCIGFVAQFTEIAAIVELLDAGNHIEMAVVIVQVQDIDGWV